MMKARDVFENLVPLLVEAIPKTILALEIAEPICCVRIYYYDTHAPCTYLLLKTVSEHDRTRMLADKGSKALGCLWASYEGSGHGPSVCLGEPDTRTSVAKLFRRLYRLLGKDEDKYMRIFRETLQRVSRELNSKDWSRLFPVTDDFVFVPADGSQFFCDEFDDIVNSIRSERLELLRSRGLLGPGRQWNRRPGYQYSDGGLAEMCGMMQEIEERIHPLPSADQVAYWIDQLDKMAAVQNCDMRRIEADSG